MLLLILTQDPERPTGSLGKGLLAHAQRNSSEPRFAGRSNPFKAGSRFK
jgi:hypothetical protein